MSVSPSKPTSVFRKVRRSLLAVALGTAAVLVAQTPASPVSAAAPDRPRITDIVQDDTAGEIRIYVSPAATGPTTTGYVVSMCNEQQTFNTASSPLVIGYEDFCISDGGFDGWKASAQSWQQQWLYIYPSNSDGTGNAAYFGVKPMQLSIPQIQSVTPYKDGCLATFSMRTMPSWAATFGGSIWDDENSFSGGSGAVSFDVATKTGKAYVPYSDYSTNWLDRAVQFQFGAAGKLNGQDVNADSPRSVEFSCPDDSNGALVQPATPVISVVPRSGAFTVNWTIANTGSHPLKRGYLVIYSSETGSGPTTILDNSTSQYVPVSTASIEANCRQEINYDPANGLKFNPYCQTPGAQEYEIYDVAIDGPGSIDTAKIWDSNAGGYLTLSNNRTYWVSLRVITYAGGYSDTTSQSASSNLVEVNPGDPPTVTAVNPSSGVTTGGTSITITGTNFANGSTVTVGGAACTNVNVASATSITCTTPARTAGTASVVVTSSGISSVANSLFTYTTPPTTTTTTVAPSTTAPAAPTLVNQSNQSTLERTPGSATAIVNGQPVAAAVETPADLPAAQVDPEDRSPAQVAALQSAADDLVNQLNQAAGGNSGLAVQDTATGASVTGLLDVPVPIENTVIVEAANKTTLFAALNEDGSVTEVQPGAVIEVLGDGQVGVVASGLTPGESAEFVIMSTPTLLGRYTVGANGTIKAQTSLPDGVGLGDHTLVVASPSIQASLGLKVSANATSLPATGASGSANTLMVALWFLVGGTVVAFIRRRRTIG